MVEKKTIKEVIVNARKSIEVAGYSKSSVRHCNNVWNKFEKYCAENDKAYFSTDLGSEFLCFCYDIVTFCDISGYKQMHIRAIDMLSQVNFHGYILVRRYLKGYIFPEAFRSIFEEYIRSREKEGIAPKGIQISKLYLERFTDYLMAREIFSLSNVDMEVISGFIRSLSAYGKPTTNHMLRTVRGVLNYAYENNIISENRSLLVPRINYNRMARIPSAYSTSEIEHLLSVVDRANPVGKRDFVFLLLASRLGLRASDICNLTFDNIKWESNSIQIFQQKTGSLLTLPILEEVGTAIIDYLKFGRPETEAKQVLIKHVYPFDKFKPSSLYTVVRRYFEKAKISIPKGKKRGPHALRHSLASALLEQNTPQNDISNILGHVDINTTAVYLKIDIPKLRNCALEVPFYSIEEEMEVLAHAEN